MDGVPRVTNVEHYARIVKEKALLRGLIHATTRFRTALEAEDDADTILDHAESSIFQWPKIAYAWASSDCAKWSPKASTASPGFTRKATASRASPPVTTSRQSDLGPPALRAYYFGGAAHRWAKRPRAEHRGKHRRARKQARRDFSLEMSKESLLLRLLSSDAKIDSHKFRTGHLNQEDKGRIPRSLSHLSEAPLWIDDTGSATVVEMGAKLRRLKRDKGLSLVIVDYMQLVSARGRFGNRNEEISSITRGLKAWPRNSRFPWSFCPSSRARPNAKTAAAPCGPARIGRDRTGRQRRDVHPSAQCFKNPGSRMEERGKTELIIAKQRNGPTDTIHLSFKAPSRASNNPRQTPGPNPIRCPLSPTGVSLCQLCVPAGRSEFRLSLYKSNLLC